MNHSGANRLRFNPANTGNPERDYVEGYYSADFFAPPSQLDPTLPRPENTKIFNSDPMSQATGLGGAALTANLLATDATAFDQYRQEYWGQQ